MNAPVTLPGPWPFEWMQAYWAAQPRAVRVFGADLRVLWDTTAERERRYPVYRDEAERLVPIPPEGSRRRDWPVARVLEERRPCTRGYLVTVDGGEQCFRVQAWPLERDGELLIVEEIERVEAMPAGLSCAASVERPDEQWRRQEDWRGGIVGVSPSLNQALELARKVARTDVNVLIVGESGTGKEIFARAIHRLSARKGEIFVPVDCASLPESLLESELFGYVKGAFTGANSDKMGLFEFAHKGTLFLDEIGEMPTGLQAKLLRVLQERQFRPIGGRKQTAVDIRVIAATNRDLDQALRDRTFRNDLYYRLNVVTLRLPPLRERPEDIGLLARHFLKAFAADNRLPHDTISAEALECLKVYGWPGNVRELQNTIERAATLAGSPVIEVEDLPEEIQALGAREGGAGRSKGALFAEKGQLVELFERDYLVNLLVAHQFNISRAADAAGCHRRTLYRMIHRHQIDLATIKEERRLGRKGAGSELADESMRLPNAETA